MAVAADLVVQEVEAVAEAGPERGRVKQLKGLGGGRPGGQLQLELLQGGGNGVRQELHPDLRHVPGGLH